MQLEISQEKKRHVIECKMYESAFDITTPSNANHPEK